MKLSIATAHRSSGRPKSLWFRKLEFGSFQVTQQLLLLIIEHSECIVMDLLSHIGRHERPRDF